MQSSHTTSLGRIGGLSISMSPSVLLASALLWLVLSLSAVWLLNMQPAKALAFGLAGLALHWVADILHQLGHAAAAARTGHPMLGIRLWWFLSSSVYPADELTLPRRIHAQRALGGPVMSLLLAALSLIPLELITQGRAVWWLALFFALNNLLVFGVGALLPLGFTDGSTLLRLVRTSE